MRGVTAMGILLIPLLGLLELVASKASAFQFIPNNDASSSMHAVTTITRRKNSIHLDASVLDNTDLTDKSSPSRRDVLLTALSGAAAAVGASTFVTQPLEAIKNTAVSTDDGAAIIGTVEEAIAWIDENCDRRFLHAVVASDYHFLYRGVVDSSSKISVINEEADLFLPETYGSQDAVDFFRQLEIVMKDDAVRPSNGHLATTSPEDAAAWGTTAASVWPVAAQDQVHYAWFQDGGLFFPRDANSLDRTKIIVDGRDCGKDSLDDALTRDSCEVMVVATRGFLAVPVSMEKELKDRLRNSFLV